MILQISSEILSSNIFKGSSGIYDYVQDFKKR